MRKDQICRVRQKEENSQANRWGEVEQQLHCISPVYHHQTFCNKMIGAVRIATTYRKDMDALVNSILTTDRHSKVTPEELARKWNIGIDTAKRTLEVTTQKGVRTAVQPMSRRVRVDHLDLHRPLMRGTWYADTLSAKVKSLTGNTCANIYTQGKFTKVIAMTAKVRSGKVTC